MSDRSFEGMADPLRRNRPALSADTYPGAHTPPLPLTSWGFSRLYILNRVFVIASGSVQIAHIQTGAYLADIRLIAVSWRCVPVLGIYFDCTSPACRMVPGDDWAGELSSAAGGGPLCVGWLFEGTRHHAPSDVAAVDVCSSSVRMCV